MKSLDSIMPMALQYFAENTQGDGSSSTTTSTSDGGNDNSTNENQTDPNSSDNTGGDDSDDDDSNTAIIEKLKGRIGKEQGKKNELQVQLNQARAELEKLRKGDMGKDAQKTPEQKKIEELEAKMARRDTVDETLSVFTESGINVPKSIVEVLVTDDHDKTIDNASKLLDFITSVQKTTESSVRKEYQGGHIPNDTKHGNGSLADFGESIAKSTQTRASLDSFK